MNEKKQRVLYRVVIFINTNLKFQETETVLVVLSYGYFYNGINTDPFELMLGNSVNIFFSEGQGEFACWFS